MRYPISNHFNEILRWVKVCHTNAVLKICAFNKALLELSNFR